MPVIREANTKGLWQLSEDIADLAEKARNKKLALDDLAGGTFTVSSLGALAELALHPLLMPQKWQFWVSAAWRLNRYGMAVNFSLGRCCRCHCPMTTG